MSTNLTLSVDLNVIKQGDTFFLYNSNGGCIAQARSITLLTTEVQNMFQASYGIQMDTFVGKSLKIREEKLDHVGKNL